MRPAFTVAIVSVAVVLAASRAMRAEQVSAAPGPVIACDGSDRNLAVYRRMHQVLFVERDGSRVGEFYAPEVILHDEDRGGVGTKTVKSADLGAMWSAARKTNPDRVLSADLIICQGPYVVVRTTARSTDKAGFAGNPPTGRPYVISGIDIYRFEHGKVVERWGNLDLAGLLRQIGYTFTPPPPTAAPTAAH